MNEIRQPNSDDGPRAQLSVPSNLLDLAQALGVDAAEAAAEGIRLAVMDARAKRYAEENREGLNGPPGCLAHQCQQDARIPAGDPERPAPVTGHARGNTSPAQGGTIGALNALLDPGFGIEGQTWFLATQSIGTVRGSRLASKVCGLQQHEGAVIKAIDHLLLGT